VNILFLSFAHFFIGLPFSYGFIGILGIKLLLFMFQVVCVLESQDNFVFVIVKEYMLRVRKLENEDNKDHLKALSAEIELTLLSVC
jgi:hypothetical protein